MGLTITFVAALGVTLVNHVNPELGRRRRLGVLAAIFWAIAACWLLFRLLTMAAGGPLLDLTAMGVLRELGLALLSTLIGAMVWAAYNLSRQYDS